MTSTGQFGDLTEGQKECLRLVLDHQTSKEIGRVLGISPFTVDQRLDAARRKLNADSRRDAAKMFASFENNDISDQLVYQPQQVENTQTTDKQTSPNSWIGRIFPRFASLISVPPIGGARHRLSKREILVQSLNIAFFGTLIIATVIIMLTGVMDLFA